MSILDILRATGRSRQPRLIGSKEFQGEPLHTVDVHDPFIPMDVVADARRGHAFNGMINVFCQPYFILKRLSAAATSALPLTTDPFKRTRLVS